MRRIQVALVGQPDAPPGAPFRAIQLPPGTRSNVRTFSPSSISRLSVFGWIDRNGAPENGCLIPFAAEAIRVDDREVAVWRGTVDPEYKWLSIVRRGAAAAPPAPAPGAAAPPANDSAYAIARSKGIEKRKAEFQGHRDGQKTSPTLV